jgi:succinate dehydrogenase/fumarate reductase flavoprotein subunit
VSNRGTTHITDVLIIGAGLAGERTAIEAASRGLAAIILSLVPPAFPIPVSEGGGGYLLDRNGDCFMPYYQPENKQVPYRDVVARHMQERIREDNCPVDLPLQLQLAYVRRQIAVAGFAEEGKHRSGSRC